MNDKLAIVTRTALCFTLLLAATGTGCAPEETPKEESVQTEGAETDTVQSALCFFSPVLPANYSADESVTLEKNTNDQVKVNSPSSGYGNGECDRYGVRYINAQHVQARAGVQITNQADCQNTTVKAQYYNRSNSSSTWSLSESDSVTGVWSQGACQTTVSFSNLPHEQVLVLGQVRRFLPGSPFSGYTNLRVSVTGTGTASINLQVLFRNRNRPWRPGAVLGQFLASSRLTPPRRRPVARCRDASATRAPTSRSNASSAGPARRPRRFPSKPPPVRFIRSVMTCSTAAATTPDPIGSSRASAEA